MSLRLLEVVADAGHLDTVLGIAEHHEVLEVWHGPAGEDGRVAVRLLVRPEKRQAVMDALQGALGARREDTRVVLLPVDAVWPPAVGPAREEATPRRRGGLTREELRARIESGARLDGSFVLLTLLSTVVAAIGLAEDNVAVVIGAMVIAPLLGPNLALALAATLGDGALLRRALATIAAGAALTLAVTGVMGALWQGHLGAAELLARTRVGLGDVALALASGTAAVLSLTTGLSSVLVGVMVAVALLPPLAAAGLMLGAGQVAAATGAGLLFAVNVASVSLAATATFVARGVRPRTWVERARARQALAVSIAFWTAFLVLLVIVILLRRQLGP